MPISLAGLQMTHRNTTHAVWYIYIYSASYIYNNMYVAWGGGIC